MDSIATKKKVSLIFIHRNRLLLAATTLIVVLSNILNIFLPLSIGWFYQIVLHDTGTKSKLLKLFPVAPSTKNEFLIAFFILAVLKSVFTFLEKYLAGISGERFSKEIRELAFSSQLKQTLQSFKTKPVGKYLLRYSGDLLAIQNFLIKGIVGFSGDIIFFIVAFACLFYIHIQLTLTVLVATLIAFIIIYLVSIFVKKIAWQRRSQRSQNLEFVSSRMQSFLTIKAFNREIPEENSFIKRSQRMYEKGIKYFSIYSFSLALQPLFFSIILILIFNEVAALRLLKPHGISKADVFIYILLLLYLQSTIKRLLKVATIWQVGIISFDKLLALVNMPKEERPESIVEIKNNMSLEFKHVTFAYDNNKTVLKDLNFSIDSKSITLIRGKNNSGKSTLLKLILKLISPQQGEILFAGIDINNLSSFEIRKKVTIVSNETPLLGNSIFKAISYSTTEEKRTAALKMLEKLNISFGNDLDPLQVRLDDGGRNISESTKKMLQYARAFLTNKKVILIEEPFNVLDAEQQEIIIAQLNLLRLKRTIILISEYEPLNLNVDKIIDL